MIEFEIPHVTRSAPYGWECAACDTVGSPGDSIERWVHEDIRVPVTLPFDHPRVESYINWIAEIEDSEIEAAEEIEIERRVAADSGERHELDDVARSLGIDPAELRDEGPEAGHRFMITFASSGSYGVVGEPGKKDADWWSDDRSVTVRAWNLRDALRKAADLPLVAWYQEDEHGCPDELHLAVDCPGDRCRHAAEPGDHFHREWGSD